MRCDIPLWAMLALLTSVYPAWGASITGIVYEDRDADGQIGAEEGLPNVIVTLYEDNGNGRFDDADQQLGNNFTTNPDGSYRFSDLDPLKGYFVNQPRQVFQGVLLTARTSGLSMPGNGTMIIDRFSERQIANVSPNTRTRNSSTRSDTILGGERDISVQFVKGGTRAKVRVNPYGLTSAFKFDQAAGVSAKATITWDGVGGTFSASSGAGLGGIDLTNGGINDGIELRLGVDGAGEDDALSIRLFDETRLSYSEAFIAPPTTNGAETASLLIPFAAFEGPISPKQVDAIQLVIGGMRPSIDLQLDQISIVGPVVENISAVAVPEPVWGTACVGWFWLLVLLASRHSRSLSNSKGTMSAAAP